MTCTTAKRLMLAAAAAAFAIGTVSAPAPAAAQMRAILPMIEEVQPLGTLPIDGVWRIRENGERIVIERGHAYAEDGWVHLGLFKIEPGQVVIQNIRELANGDFIAQDLPLMSAVKLEWLNDETLRARTEGLIPVTYHLDLVAGDGPGWDDDDRDDDRDDVSIRPPSDDDDDYVSPW